MLRDMTFVILLGLILPASAATSNLGMSVYHLHQVLNYLGLAAAGTYLQGQSLARTHLANIRGADFQGAVFQDIYGAMLGDAHRDPTKKRAQDFESLRLRLSDALQSASIDHDLRWHREVHEQCPLAPKVE